MLPMLVLDNSEHEWDMQGRVPDKLSGFDYGFIVNGKAMGCGRDDLSSTLVSLGLSNIQYVWTPETPEPVLPEKIPLLRDAFRKMAAKEARKAIYWGCGLVTFSAGLALLLHEWMFLYRSLFAILGVLGLAEGSWQLVRIRNYSMENAGIDAGSLRFAAWIEKKHVRPLIQTILD
jgi:hypothetical protein